jgi:hypothetical protein
MKICSKCKIEKTTSEFSVDKRHKSGLQSQCIECYKKQYSSQKRKHRYEQNKEKINKAYKQYYEQNKEKIIKRNKLRRRNPETKLKEKEYKKEYCKKNKEKRNIQRKIRRQNDINYKLKITLRHRVCMTIKKQSGKKAKKTIELLGCSIEKCRQHLESLFQEGMTWNNHGLYGWHIDHIIPCSSFNLTNLEEQKKCFHYTNLQPLWAENNLSKGNKI